MLVFTGHSICQKQDSMTDYQHIRGFLDDYSYPWIEALAWMQKLSDAITSINTLELLTYVSQSLA
jgi:hypothetical protein